MLKKVFCLFLISALCLSGANAHALSTSAASAVLIEATSGHIIYEKNAHRKMPMASTTKIMTALCTIENINTNIPITVDRDAIGVEGSSIYLEPGEVMTVKELLYAMMLNSGNDAATALAIAVSGSVEDFCKLMNQTSRNIGAKNTNFKNPSGLYEDDHYTTAHDLALITAYAMKNPLFCDIVSTKEMKISKGTGGSRYLKNHNKLLWQYEGCTGVKTGFTKKCGRCLVSSAKKDGVSLVAVTLNAPDDWRDHTAMLDYGFESVTPKIIADEGEYATTVNAGGAYVPVYFEKRLTAPSIVVNGTSIEYTLKSDSSLPINTGETLGVAKLVYDGAVVASSPLIALESKTTAHKKSLRQVFKYILISLFRI